MGFIVNRHLPDLTLPPQYEKSRVLDQDNKEPGHSATTDDFLCVSRPAGSHRKANRINLWVFLNHLGEKDRDMKTLMLTVFLTLILTTPAHAFVAYGTGRDLQDKCTDGRQVARAYCDGYISAIASALNYVGIGPYKTCIPQEVTVNEMRKIVVQHMSDYPQDLMYTAVDLIAEPLVKNFPCEGQ